MDERIVDQPRVKRVYVSPKIVRVRLNPEQAVLSVCSITSTSILNNIMTNCENLLDGDINCRKASTGGAQDLAATS